MCHNTNIAWRNALFIEQSCIRGRLHRGTPRTVEQSMLCIRHVERVKSTDPLDDLQIGGDAVQNPFETFAFSPGIRGPVT